MQEIKMLKINHMLCKFAASIYVDSNSIIHCVEFFNRPCKDHQLHLINYEPFSGIEDVSRFDNSDKKYYITKMTPRITRNPHYEDGLSPVRFIILNRCNPEDRRAANLLERWSKESGAVQCQSRDFFAVSHKK